MSWWVHLEDLTAEPWCSYGQSPRPDVEEWDQPCPVPCYPDVTVDAHSEGGTYVLGGTGQAELNVTYNYGRPIWQAMQTIKTEWPARNGDGESSSTLGVLLHQQRAGDVTEVLERLVGILGTARDSDYWEPTDGNAGHALNTLLGWARQYPEAVFRVS